MFSYMCKFNLECSKPVTDPGVHGTCTTSGSNFLLFSCRFRGKLAKILDWRPYLDPPLSYSSCLDILIKIVLKFCSFRTIKIGSLETKQQIICSNVAFVKMINEIQCGVIRKNTNARIQIIWPCDDQFYIFLINKASKVLATGLSNGMQHHLFHGQNHLVLSNSIRSTKNFYRNCTMVRGLLSSGTLMMTLNQ